jgi:hypothetical protein
MAMERLEALAKHVGIALNAVFGPGRVIGTVRVGKIEDGEVAGVYWENNGWSIGLQGAGDEVWGDKRLEWVLGRAHVVRGCRTMRNGDPGWPDDVDIVEVGRVEDNGLLPLGLVKRAIAVMVEEMIDNAWEALQEEQVLRAEEEYEDKLMASARFEEEKRQHEDVEEAQDIPDWDGDGDEEP